MKRILSIALTLCFLSTICVANSRIKDIADFEGVRENQLVGYGIVVGLDGTGDNVKSIDFTKESIITMLDRLGINARDGQLKSRNVAAVMVTANLPAFAKAGSKIDVMASAMGDAKSLKGGTLLVTPLLGANGQVYAVAQGQLAIGGGNIDSMGVETSGRIANGAIVENETNFDLSSLNPIKISLRNPDFTTAKRVAEAINTHLGQDVALALNSSSIEVEIPNIYKDKLVSLLTKIEQLKVQPDQLARIVIDEASGIVVIGKDVRINKLAVAQGNLTIKIADVSLLSEPEPFEQGYSTVSDYELVEAMPAVDAKLSVMDMGVNLQDMVDGLNALGVSPRDLISILQAIKASGALQADIEVI